MSIFEMSPASQLIDVSSAAALPSADRSGAATTRKKPRDLRLDFFRGACMLIIFVAHVPGNWLYHWIPARFGLSDAAHMFVFISGYAAAIAFGGTFVTHGFGAGTARILWRCAQLYAVHIGLFVVVATMCVAFAENLGGIEYARQLGMAAFFAEPGNALLALFSLTYVPPFFDILPLYMVVLAMVPLAVALAHVHRLLPIAASFALWLAVQIWDFGLPAGYADGALWGFNPFAWQLLFFSGFALSRGWIKAPRFSRSLLAIAGAYVALSAAIMVAPIYEAYAPLHDLREWAIANAHKPDLDIRQYLHFLALALVVIALLRGHEERLGSVVAAPFVRLGQQALIVFVTGMGLSHLGGMVMTTYGTELPVQLAVNGAAFAALFAVAYVAAYLKSPPWKSRKPAERAPAMRSVEAAPVPLRAVG